MYKHSQVTLMHWSHDYQLGANPFITAYTRVNMWRIQWFKGDEPEPVRYKVSYSTYMFEMLPGQGDSKHIPGKDESFDFSTFEEADSKFQTICLKAFAQAMSNRGGDRVEV